MSDHSKILFRLAKDADGYPPVATEGLWAENLPDRGKYRLDNIPFFTRDAALGDVIAAKLEDGKLWFDHVHERSNNSLVRIVFFDGSCVQETRASLATLGCNSEWDEPHNLVAVNVPITTKLEAVQEYLKIQSSAGKLDYEEPILRQ